MANYIPRRKDKSISYEDIPRGREEIESFILRTEDSIKTIEGQLAAWERGEGPERGEFWSVNASTALSAHRKVHAAARRALLRVVILEEVGEFVAELKAQNARLLGDNVELQARLDAMREDTGTQA